MFNFFKEKCPVCKMDLEKGKTYPEIDGKKFCSQNCKEEYNKGLVKEKSKHSCCNSCH